MWYLIAGRLMSGVSFFVFYKVTLNPGDLNLLDRLFGWFFFEHVFEEYGTSVGKFFLTNAGFRTLMENVLIVVRNILTLSHFLTLTEFLLTVSILLLLIYFLFHFLKINRVKGKKNEVGIFIYYAFVIHILVIKTSVSFNLSDIYFIFKPISILAFTFLVPLVLLRFWVSHSNISTHLNGCLKNRVYFVKMSLYLLILLLVSIIVVNSLAIVNSLSNNFLQEFLLKIAIVYTYVYYSFQLYKCQPSTSYVEKNDP